MIVVVVKMVNIKSIFNYRSRPVVKVMAEFKFLGKSKLIALEEKTCTLKGGAKAACARLMYCLAYDGINVDQHISKYTKKLYRFTKKKFMYQRPDQVIM